MHSPLERLQALADHCAAQDSLRLVLVPAEEGAGRSHLLEQLVARRPRTFMVRCTGEGTLGRVLRALTELEGGDVEQRLLTAPALLALDPERRPLVAALLASLVTGTTAGLDAASRTEGACAQLVHVLSFAAATAPLVLAIDDAHHADAQAIAFFDALAHVDTPLPALVVFTVDTAPEFSGCAFLRHQAHWPERRRGESLAIPALTPDALDALLQRHGCNPTLAARLAAVVNGNPSLALGVWAVLQTDLALADKALPLTFDALRVESVRVLGPSAFELAQRASVLGDRFLIGALEATGPVSELPSLFRISGPVVGFIDRRVRLALTAGITDAQSAAWRNAAGAWAVNALSTLPGALDAKAEYVLPLALPRLAGEQASLWQEAWASWLADRGRLADSVDALAAAAHGTTGVRRTALIRRIADGQLLAGQPEKVLITLQSLGRVTPTPSPMPTTDAARALQTQQRPLLERWETLTPDAANAAVELVRAEAYSHLVRKEDTIKAFTELEKKLERLGAGPKPSGASEDKWRSPTATQETGAGPKPSGASEETGRTQEQVSAHLWIRWAKSWTWFLCEILGQPVDAAKACEKVRRRVPAEVLKDDAQTLEFLRAQQMACTTGGDFARALVLVEELIALSRTRGDLRAQCLAWNGRAILHFGQGELAGARRSFERSLDLARATGWKRREAIAIHNLSLVLLELGELDAAQAGEEKYAVLSVAIGNHAATAEAPAVLAGVALARGDLPRADALIAQARKAAQSNEWTMLLAWSRALAGKMRVQKYAETRDSLELAKAKNDFLAALDLFEEHSTAWTEEIDPGEVYALYAAALKLGGQDRSAREALERGAKHVPAQNVVSLRALATGRAFVTGEGLDAALEWFEGNGYQRLSRLWRQLAG